MNIFFLSMNPKRAAQYHVDRHVTKMILETAQILCTVTNDLIDETQRDSELLKKLLYKPTHRNHPCTRWARKSETNFRWLADLGLELVNEHFFRFKSYHKSEFRIQYCLKLLNQGIIQLPKKSLTTPALAMPDEYKVESIIESYQNYYKHGKKHLHKWSKRKKPIWINDFT